MTTKKLRTARLPTPGQMMFGFMCGFSLILILRNSDAAIEYMGNGLRLCARTVIPSLFPFMVISELIVSSGLGDMVGKYLDRPVRWLFGISGVSSCALVLGAVCGFPIGARTTAALLDGGCIDRREASRLLTFCNNPSSAFIVSAVGVSLYSNRSLGVILYTVTLINSLIIGIAQRLFYPKTAEIDAHKAKIYPSGVDAFTSSVTRSAQGMLAVCAYVVFFAAIIGCLSELLFALDSSPYLTALIYGLTELSGGVSSSAALGVSLSGVCLSAFIVGWSGLSVHFQVISVCSGKGLSYRGYFIAKLIQGLLNALVMYLLCTLFPLLLTTPAESTEAGHPILSAAANPYIIAVLLLFSLSIPFAIFGNGKNRFRKSQNK